MSVIQGRGCRHCRSWVARVQGVQAVGTELDVLCHIVWALMPMREFRHGFMNELLFNFNRRSNHSKDLSRGGWFDQVTVECSSKVTVQSFKASSSAMSSFEKVSPGIDPGKRCLIQKVLKKASNISGFDQSIISLLKTTVSLIEPVS